MSSSSTTTKMASHVNKTTGVKGSDVYDSTGDPRLDLNVKLVRGADRADLEASTLAAASVSLADAAVMAFHARNVRGGKGERDLFRHMFVAMDGAYPGLAAQLVEFVPAYGCWRDLFTLAGDAGISAGLKEAIYEHVATVLHDDGAAPATDAAGKAVSISLAGKWAPRESSAGLQSQEQARTLAKHLYPMAPQFSTRMRAYRKLLSGLNARLNTVETLMSAGRWDEIAPPSVPGRAGKLYTRAFLNLVNTKSAGEKLGPEDRSRLRHPDDAKRMACRAAFEAHYARAKEGKAKVHGADTLFPHEVVKAVYSGLPPSAGHRSYMAYYGGEAPSAELTEAEKDHLRAVWRSMVEKARAAGGLRRSIFMSDFSGSMQSTGQGDTPYWVSMALGLLGAEVVEGDGFKDRFMTFDSNPTWHELPASEDIFERVDTVMKSDAGQGTSTDFQKAMDMVLARLKAQRIRPGEEPENLIVLTDMNWDQAACSSGYGAYTGNSYRHHVKHTPWETHVEMIRESFKRAGEDMWGPVAAGGLGGWAMPRIVIWNLAASPSAKPLGTDRSANGLNLSATTTDFHATADTPGVAMLSGWSPTQFRVLCEAGPRQLTPMEILRIELDDPRYDPVRRAVTAWEADSSAAAAGGGGWISRANGFGAEEWGGAE